MEQAGHARCVAVLCGPLTQVVSQGRRECTRCEFVMRERDAHGVRELRGRRFKRLLQYALRPLAGRIRQSSTHSDLEL